MSDVDSLWLISISAGYWQIAGINTALEQGFCVYALDGDAEAPGLKLATKSGVVDIKDAEGIIDMIEASGIKPAGVVSYVSEVGMLSAAAVRKHYQLPGPDFELTRRLTNKAVQRAALQKGNVFGPEWKTFSSLKEAQKEIGRFEFPVIVKPADSAGSRGVTKVEGDEEFEEAVGFALKCSESRQGLIESFMNGVEYAVETFGDGCEIHVLAVTEKKKVSGTKGLVAQELATPDDPDKAKIASDLAVCALKVLGYLFGPGHTEVIIHNDNNIPGIVEAAGRGGGFMVFERMVEKASGVDIISATILDAIGKKPAVHAIKNKAVVLRFIASQEGIVSSIEGVEEANALSKVDVGVLVELGERVGNVQGDGDRLAFILTEGDSPEEAQRLADHAGSIVKINVRRHDVDD